MISVQQMSKEFTFYVKDTKKKVNFIKRKKCTKTANCDINLEIKDGELIGLAGANGAGKTTLLKILAGVLKPDKGEVLIDGVNPFGANDKFKKNFSIILGQRSQLWWDLPAEDTIQLNRIIYDVPDENFYYIYNKLLDMMNVRKLKDVPVRRLSLGERMKFEIIAGLIHNPKLIMLDEPTIGLDLMSQRNIREFLKYYNKEFGATILLTSHYMQDIYDVCDRLVLLQEGKIIFDNKIEKMMRNDEKIFLLKMLNEKNEKNFLNNYPFAMIDQNSREIRLLVEQEKEKEIINDITNHYEYVDFSIQNPTIEEIIMRLLE